MKKRAAKKKESKSSKKKKPQLLEKQIPKPSKKEISKTPKISRKETKARIPTGIPGLDKLISNGFTKNSTNMVVGGSGSGKTILATQFLMEGLKKKESCLYITFEEKREEFFSNMLNFGWDLEKYEKQGLFHFLEYSPVKVKTMLEEGGGTIENLVLSKKITRIVIDSITSFALLFKEEHSKREAALDLFNMISKWSCTSIVTLEEHPTTSNSKSSSKPLEFETDSIILLYFIREKGQRNRYLEILKMRGTNHSKKLHSFSIEESGISIGSHHPTSFLGR